MVLTQWRSEGPAGSATAGGHRGARGIEGARLEEIVAVSPWPGAQTSCLQGARKSSLRHCAYIVAV